MTLESEFCLFPESGDQGGFALHGLEAVSGELADFANGVQAQVGDLVFLQVGPDGFDRIEFWGIRRQTRDSDMAVQLFEPGIELAAAMNGSTIPDDQKRLRDLTLERAKEFNDLLGTNGTREEAKVELPERQAGNGRELFPGEAVLKDRRLAAQAPGAGDTGSLAQSGFVDEDEGATFPLGFFLSAGQSRRFQVAISDSLRWMARFSGFWHENPMRRSRCHRWPVLYSTPKRASISLPMRGSVHNSVGYPAANAPAISILLSSRSCSASIWRGLPNSPRLSASFPPLTSRCSHPATVCRVTPSRRATSDFVMPFAKSFAPLSRRFSNALKSRLCFIVAPRNDHKQINAITQHGVDRYLYDSQ
jgi:hypothetical protein